MGKENRQRRADKRRRADRRATHQRPWRRSAASTGRYGFEGAGGAAWGPDGDDPPPPPPAPLDKLVVTAVYAQSAGRADLPDLIDHLASHGERDRARLSEVLADLLVKAVGECWAQGWQPADLDHVIGRRLRVPHRRVCATAIDLDARSYRWANGADPTWMAQVDAVTEPVVDRRPDQSAPNGLFPDDSAEPAGSTGTSARTRGDGRTDDRARLLDHCVARAGTTYGAVLAVVETLAGLYELPAQPRLCPPPSEWGRGPTRAAGAPPAPRPTGSTAADPKMVERVRALLAKAESTDFPDEAEAFTAKAQELVARHAIDMAMLQGTSGEDPRARGRRVLLDDPYSLSKGRLLSGIASANRCRAVLVPSLGLATIFGTTDDLDAVELLYASLLTQAIAAMVRAGRAGARSRSRAFRNSFLVAYAARIGQRLREATSTAVDEARSVHGENVLPVLASREAEAEAACDEAFPRLVKDRVRTSDPAGWVAGRAAADMARLGPTTALRAG